MNENNNIEENKIIEDKKPVEEKKPSDKKRLTKKIVDGVIVLGAVILFSIGFLFSNVIIKKNNDYIGNYKTLTEEEYKTIVKEYGDAATKIVEEYKKDNDNELPIFDHISSKIKIPNYSVSCSNRQVNPDGSVYLANCTVRGYVSHYDYEYGEYVDYQKASGKLYFYKQIRGNDDFIVVSDTNKKEETNNYVLLDEYSCKASYCIAFYKPANNCSYVVIFDDGKRFLYDTVTKESIVIDDLSIPATSSIGIIANSLGVPTNISLVDGMNKLAYINVATKQRITDFDEFIDVTNSSLVDNGILAMKKQSSNNIYFLSNINGQLIKQIDDSIDFAYKNVNGINLLSIYYKDLKYSLLDSSFNNLGGIAGHYKYAINSDNTITLIFDNYYINITSSGEVLYKSSTYSGIIGAVEDYILLRANDEILLVSPQGKTITKLLDFIEPDRYIYTNAISKVNLNGDTCITYVVVDTSLKSGDVGYNIQYTYNITTGAIKVDKYTGR